VVPRIAIFFHKNNYPTHLYPGTSVTIVFSHRALQLPAQVPTSPLQRPDPNLPSTSRTPTRRRHPFLAVSLHSERLSPTLASPMSSGMASPAKQKVGGHAPVVCCRWKETAPGGDGDPSHLAGKLSPSTLGRLRSNPSLILIFFFFCREDQQHCDEGEWEPAGGERPLGGAAEEGLY
jgi:hypothetical protein